MLQEKLSRWATAGLITEDQSKRILAYEAAAAKQEERRVPLIVEALGYLGGALAVIAVLILAHRTPGRRLGAPQLTAGGDPPIGGVPVVLCRSGGRLQLRHSLG